MLLEKRVQTVRGCLFGVKIFTPTITYFTSVAFYMEQTESNFLLFIAFRELSRRQNFWPSILPANCECFTLKNLHLHQYDKDEIELEGPWHQVQFDDIFPLDLNIISYQATR